MLDLHLLDARTTLADVDRLIARALDRTVPPVRGVVVPPVFARHAADRLRGSGVRVASVAGHPLGLTKPTVKAIEATSLAKDGVDAIELTPLAAHLLAGDHDALRRELLEVVRGCRAARATIRVHVRLDVDVLDGVEWAAVALAIVQGACDGVVIDGTDARRVEAVLRATADGVLDRKVIGIDVADVDVTRGEVFPILV